MLREADIILVQGHSWATAPVQWVTGGRVSHAGLVIAIKPFPIIIESTWPRVRTVPLSKMIEDDELVLALEAQNLTDYERGEIVNEALKFSATNYSLVKAGMLGMDNLLDTDFFTSHFNFTNNSICCYLDVVSYRKMRKFFGKAPDANVDCEDMLKFAESHPHIFKILRLR